MCKLVAKILLLTILFGQAFYLTPSVAYRQKVHEKITENAAIKSMGIKSALEAIGLMLPGEELDKVKIKNKDLNKWIQRGASWEDNFQFNWGNILFCHFHNPVTDKGYTLPSGTEVGQSLIVRANDTTNEWSYEMAKMFYYAALTGDNNEIVDSFTHIRDDMNPNHISGQTNMTKEDRDQYFAWTLQALGHTLHLVQDASVPAHTRNDFHGLFEPFEKWTNKNLKYLADNNIFNEEGSNPWTYWNQHADPLIPDVFIDTNQLENNDTAPISGSDQGIAEYSHANFMSEDTIFTFDLPLKPDLSEFFTNYQSDDFNLETENINGRDMTFVYLKNKHPGGVDHLLLAGVLHSHPISSPTIQDVRWTTNDRKVHEDYASKLIPRAVGYSAGLLDYFFRGAIEITLPDNGVYALTDIKPDEIDPSQQGFDHITLLAKNISTGDEEMTGGTVTLVVKYKLGQGDQFQNSPPATSDEFYYIVKELEGTHLIPRDTPTLFEFNINDSQIPLWATDVYIYLIYKGELGQEEGAIAAGFKDICEPTPIDFINVMDKACLYGELYDSGSDQAIALVDEDENGIVDYYEWDVFAHDANDIFIRFSPADNPVTASPDINNTYYHPHLSPEETFRLFFLSDYQLNRSVDFYNTKIDDRDQCDSFHGRLYVLYGGAVKIMGAIMNQTIQTAPFTRYTPTSFHEVRGINTHFMYLFDNLQYPLDQNCDY